MKVISAVIISVLSILLSAGAVFVILWHDRIARNKENGQMVFKVNGLEYPPRLLTERETSTVIPVLNEAVRHTSAAPPTTFNQTTEETPT